MIGFDVVSHCTKDPEESLSYWNSSFERKILDSWHIFNSFVLSVQRKTVQSEGWHCCGITVYISFSKFGSLNGEFWTGSEHRSPRVTFVDIQFFLWLYGMVELWVLLQHPNNMHMNWEFSTEMKTDSLLPLLHILVTRTLSDSLGILFCLELPQWFILTIKPHFEYYIV
jgi:hypothetical protein